MNNHELDPAITWVTIVLCGTFVVIAIVKILKGF